MRRLIVVAIAILISVFLLWPPPQPDPVDLSWYSSDNTRCFDRTTQPSTSVVDSHIHFRPFGGPAIPFEELNDYFNRTGVLFANIYGIGQTLPIDSKCIHYTDTDCTTMPVLPTIKNDIINADNYLEHPPQGVHMVVSMTFPDLASPDNIVSQIELLDRRYPSVFKWMGEANLVKQALLKNSHFPATKDNIIEWKPFMKMLRVRDIPLTIHADLGDDNEPKKYLPLMEYVLQQYPDNKIVWAHLGLSMELVHMDVPEHILTMEPLLEEYPNLMFDISWRVLEDKYFSDTQIRDQYVAFFNTYPSRFLTGTDFVAAREKTFEVYTKELDLTSNINQYLSDDAYRRIALGQNYIDLLGLDHQAPQICEQ